MQMAELCEWRLYGSLVQSCTASVCCYTGSVYSEQCPIPMVFVGAVTIFVRLVQEYCCRKSEVRQWLMHLRQLYYTSDHNLIQLHAWAPHIMVMLPSKCQLVQFSALPAGGRIVLTPGLVIHYLKNKWLVFNCKWIVKYIKKEIKRTMIFPFCPGIGDVSF